MRIKQAIMPEDIQRKLKAVLRRIDIILQSYAFYSNKNLNFISYFCAL